MRRARQAAHARTAARRGTADTPAFNVVSRRQTGRNVALPSSWPVVIKPAVLSGSRGVILRQYATEFLTAFERVRRLLDTVDIRALRDPAADDILIESFIPGREYALEGVLHKGALHSAGTIR